MRRSIVGRDGTQTVYVYVTDQRGWPVENAAVKMVVHYQTGDQRYVFEPTNARGFTSTSFQLPEAPLGRRVVIDVTAALGTEVQGETQSSFVPWW